MGDDDLVPTFTDGPSGIPSDLKYSLKTDADELPDLAIGRILGNDQAAVATAVTKILGYETTAPTGNGMLNKALIAAQFQDDDNDGQENRTFITMAETVRNGLVARGVAVDRVYGESPGNNPQRFQDGSALPAALLKPTASAGTAPARRSPPAGTRAASWSSTATTAGRTAGARRATARPTSRR